MRTEILPPEKVVAAEVPQMKLRQLPVAFLYLGGTLGVVAVLVFGAVILEAIMALLAFLIIAGMFFLVGALLVFAACRKRTYSNCS